MKTQPMKQSALLLSILALCLLLLGACGTPSTTAATPISTPPIDAHLQNQGDTQLKAFDHWIGLMQQYGGDTTIYQQQYNADQLALRTAETNTAYNVALTTVKAHIAAIQLPALKAESQNLQQQLQQQVASWGRLHQYHDAYNNTNYPLGYEYGPNGIGGWIQDEVSSASTLADYQQAVQDVTMFLTNFQAMKTNNSNSDTTHYNQPHKTDLQLMQHYDKNGKVVIVSLEEQAVRVYQNGQLVRAFLTTTGRPERPSLPGAWWVEGKESPTVFKAGAPKGSPDWYPDTPINYAMQYHSDGYFIHDSWWRVDYGPGTNFPHVDASGDSFSSQGSHGCINVSKGNAAWLYGFVTVYTSIVIY